MPELPAVTRPFTPGPWTVDGRFDDDASVSIIGANGEVFVCEIEPVLGEWGEDEIANARLIAAAPEMFEAVKELLATLHQSPEQHEGCDRSCARKQYFNLIARVEGKHV